MVYKQAWSIKNSRYVWDVSVRLTLAEEAIATRKKCDKEKARVRKCVICLKYICNFLCSMLVYAPFALCFVYTLWRFYAFSGTNLLTRCHSASSLFSAIYMF
jgi:hypothetical protein